MRAVKVFVAGVVGLAGMTVLGGGAAEAGGPSVDETKSVTWPLRSEKKLRATPIPGGGTSYYCAVGTFVSFNDVAGWEPVSGTGIYFDSPYTEPIGPAPYDDNSAIDGIAFPPVGGKHQTQLGDYSYSQGGYATPEAAAAECEALRARSDSFWGPNATITYEHTDKCKSAISKLNDAKAKVKAAKKRLDLARTPREIAAARAALQDAKAKLKKAKSKYKKKCK